LQHQYLIADLNKCSTLKITLMVIGLIRWVIEMMRLSMEVDACIADMVDLGETSGIAAELCSAAFLAG
jgi:hypothetical protein